MKKTYRPPSTLHYWAHQGRNHTFGSWQGTGAHKKFYMPGKVRNNHDIFRGKRVLSDARKDDMFKFFKYMLGLRRKKYGR